MSRLEMSGKASGWVRFAMGTALAAVTLALVGCATPNNVLRERAVVALSQHDVDRADQYLLQAVAQDPTDWEAQFMLGKVEIRQGKYLEARLKLERALALHPEPLRQDLDLETPEILDALAEALYGQGDKVGLVNFLKQTAGDRHRTRDYIRQARFLNKIGDTDGTALALKKAAALAGKSNPFPHLQLADFYHEMNDTDGEIMALRRAYTIDPENFVICERVRSLGVVPGPTVLLPPSE
jgi:tetratricopeptide (TPR) repeat protein